MTAESTPSIIRLVAGLSPWHPRLAYEALVDPTGEFRESQPTDLHTRTHAADLALELRLCARTEAAARLNTLVSELPSSADAALHVVLLCAQNIRRIPPPRPPGFFAAPPEAAISPPLLETRRDEVRPVAFPLPEAERVPRVAPQAATAPPDALADAARFHTEHAVWLHDHVSPPPAPAVPPARAIAARMRLHVAADPFAREHAALRALAPPSTPSRDDNSPAAVRDAALLDFVLRRLLSGPEADGDGDMPGPATPLSPTTLPPPPLCTHLRAPRAAAGARAARARLRALAAPALQAAAPTDPLAALIAAAEAIGMVYRDVLSFSETYSPLAGPRQPLAALAAHAADVCAVFHAGLRRVASDEAVELANRPWAAVHAAETALPNLVAVADVLARVDGTDGSAIAIMNLALEENVRSPDNRAVHALFYRVIAPFVANVWDWVFEASVRRDSEQTFFGTRLGLASVSESEALSAASKASPFADERDCAVYPDVFNEMQARFVLRAGRTRELLSFFGMQQGALGVRPPDIDISAPGRTGTSFRTTLSELADYIIQEAQADAKRVPDCLVDVGSPSSVLISKRRLENGTGEGSSCQDDFDPVFTALDFKDLENHPFGAKDVPRPVFWRSEDADALETYGDEADKSPFTGLLRNYDEKCKSMEECTLPPFSTDERMPHGSMFAEVLLEPLRKIDIVIQEQVMRRFVEDLQLFEHLKNLRAHALLGAGDFASVLIEQIDIVNRTSEANERYIHRRANAAMTFFGTSGAGEKNLRDRTHLNRCLKAALNLYSTQGHPFADRLYLDSDMSDQEDFSSSDKLGLWDTRMELKYSVEFPLNIVLSERALSMYSKLFDLFVRVLRARKSLATLFMMSRRRSVLRNVERNRGLGDSKLTGALWQFCWHAEHFVSIFGGFEMEQVLGACWDRFESGWSNVKNIWELRDRHNMFLEESIKRCLLNEKHRNVLKVMSGGFDIVVAVEQGVDKLITHAIHGPLSETKDVIDLLSSSTASLKRRCSFLTDVLERLVESGTLPHLRHLLNKLNFNHYYVKEKR